MKIAALCCTYNRPRLLRQSLWMFQQQTHVDKELVILDDAGQYRPQSGDNWRLISCPRRFGSFGHKRNVCAHLASLDADAFAVWDDDDAYLPWALEAHAAALEQKMWSRPSLCWDASDEWHTAPLLCEQAREGMSYHGAWAWRREAFNGAGGYLTHVAGDLDTTLAGTILKNHGPSADPLSLGYDPFYVYCAGHASVRFNDMKRWNYRESTADERAQWGTPEWVGTLTPLAVPEYNNPLRGPHVTWQERERYKRK